MLVNAGRDLQSRPSIWEIKNTLLLLSDYKSERAMISKLNDIKQFEFTQLRLSYITLIVSPNI